MTTMSGAAPPHRRGSAMALYSGCLLTGQALGPALSGAVAAVGTWRTSAATGALLGLAVTVVALTWETAAGTQGGAPSPRSRPHGPRLRPLERAVLSAIGFGVFFTVGAMPQTLLPLIGADELESARVDDRPGARSRRTGPYRQRRRRRGGLRPRLPTGGAVPLPRPPARRRAAARGRRRTGVVARRDRVDVARRVCARRRGDRAGGPHRPGPAAAPWAGSVSAQTSAWSSARRSPPPSTRRPAALPRSGRSPPYSRSSPSPPCSCCPRPVTAPSASAPTSRWSEPMDLVVIVVAIGVGAFVKGVTGTGLPQIAIPVMAAVIGVERAVIIMAIPGILSNGWWSARTGHVADRRATCGFSAWPGWWAPSPARSC